MAGPVVAIGLDAADPELVERWAADGHLPNLARLRAAGAYGRLENIDRYRAETPWTTFLAGVRPDRTDYWGRVEFDPRNYRVFESGTYDFEEFPPFYALGGGARICAFDLPHGLASSSVEGLQAFVWGDLAPRGPAHSRPARLMNDLLNRYGSHPAVGNDFANIYDGAALDRLAADLQVGLKRRTAICRDLLQRERWDLFLAAISEPHAAGHIFWHTDMPHPLSRLAGARTGTSLLDVYRATDQSLGDILAAAPDDATIVVFSLYGMVADCLDVTSMLVLPELLYRWSFPGRAALAPGGAGAPPPASADYRQHWSREVWRLRDPEGSVELDSPDEQDERGLSLAWQPANWYGPCWPGMKAFALPSYSDGCVRVNLAGREARGRVAPEDYDAVLDEVTEVLMALRDGRGGGPVTERVIRTRRAPDDADRGRPDADLVVIWRESAVTDVFDSPTLGRIGPVPFYRAGSHRSLGFVAITGPGVTAGSELPDRPAEDLPPTILALMGQPVPARLDGDVLPLPALKRVVA